MRFIKFILIATAFLGSCAMRGTDSLNDFDVFLSKRDNIAINHVLKYESKDNPIFTPLNMVVDSEGRAVIVDASSWTIHLISDNGEHLDVAGGYGKGPGEFIQINQIHIGVSGELYVYDPKSGTSTTYTISDSGLNFEDEFTLTEFKNLSLKSLYEVNEGYIGVYKEYGNAPVDGKSNFKVFKLGEDFQILELLFEMVGNETYDYRGMQRESPLGQKTVWAIWGTDFYYSHTDDFSVNLVDIHDGTRKYFMKSNIPKSQMGEVEIEYFTSELTPYLQLDPTFADNIKQGKVLPYFQNFIVTDEHFFFSLFETSSDPKPVLRINRESGNIDKISVPDYFNLYGVHENKLYGISYTSKGDISVTFLQI